MILAAQIFQAFPSPCLSRPPVAFTDQSDESGRQNQGPAYMMQPAPWAAWPEASGGIVLDVPE